MYSDQLQVSPFFTLPTQSLESYYSGEEGLQRGGGALLKSADAVSISIGERESSSSGVLSSRQQERKKTMKELVGSANSLFPSRKKKNYLMCKLPIEFLFIYLVIIRLTAADRWVGPFVDRRQDFSFLLRVAR